MYVIDARHYLDDRGAIAPERGPARKMADFITSVIAHASDFDRPDGIPGPVCFRWHVSSLPMTYSWAWLVVVPCLLQSQRLTAMT
jgi:hypothetical protein